MAFAATASTTEPRSFSHGPRKCQIFTFTAVSGDTSGTVTATGMQYVENIVIDSLVLTAAPTFATNVVTLAFANPAANRFGTLMVFGR